ncbi:MAG: aminodeoxychorismate lyase [Gammaproteobacteria bacterium]|nr:aminodeoxychorismate lyase [Gammaproteobacteria bacterium]
MSVLDGVRSESLPLGDWGLAYGDGHFETLAVVGGIPPHAARHLARLRAGAARLGIACPPHTAWQDDRAKNMPPGRRRWVVQLILTRGAGGRGYTPAASSRRIVQIFDWPLWPADCAMAGIETAVCVTCLGINPGLAGATHLNPLAQVLARAELSAAGLIEGLMLDQDDHLSEGTRSNVFVGLGDSLRTPQLDRCGVAGILREIILEQAAEVGMEILECRLPGAQLGQATEIFGCHSLIGIWPVHRLLGPCVRESEVGPLTRQLQLRLGGLQSSR